MGGMGKRKNGRNRNGGYDRAVRDVYYAHNFMLGCDPVDADEWVTTLGDGRYVSDVSAMLRQRQTGSGGAVDIADLAEAQAALAPGRTLGGRRVN